MDQTVTFAGGLEDRSRWTMDACPMAKALDVIGTRSALLLMREAFYGTTRFDDFRTRVGLSEAVTAARLRELTDLGLLERSPYREPGQRTRYEYRLTEKGLDLAPVAVGLFNWGAKYESPGGVPPINLAHKDCGSPIRAEVRCGEGHPVAMGDVEATPRRRAARR